MADFTPTEEQVAAITTAHEGKTFVLDSVAGSGKTSTARKMCTAIGGSVLYLVYNKAAAEDARKSFPKNGVKISTTSALAWHEYKTDYGERILNSRVPANVTAKLAGITQKLDLGPSSMPMQPTTIARLAIDTIQKFCYSADFEITEKHTPVMPMGIDPLQEAVIRDEVTRVARKIWKDSLSPASQHRFTFDHAYKLLVMSQPNLGYQTVIIDEAQDSNAATLHLLQSQMDSQIIAIGDPAQQLYAWRGAMDIMGSFDGPRLTLSKSFRFGQAIADEAEKWLAHTGTGIHITGSEHIGSKVTVGHLPQPRAVLCRTNSAVMSQAMHYMKANKRVAVAGGTTALVSLAYAASDLRGGKPTTHPELAAFKDWGELMAYTDEPGGGDLKALVQLINEHGVPDIIGACKKLVDEVKGNPDITISTGHKAKGREWESVEVDASFKEPPDVEDPRNGEMSPGPIDKHSAMLHYVTVTRAERHLNRAGLAWVDRHPKIDKTGKAL